MLILEVQTKTLFAKLTDVYPQCLFLIEDEPKLYPLICLKDTCHRNANCMFNLAKKVKYIFDQFPQAELLFLYFTYRDRPKVHRSGVFWRDMREPKYITFNPWAWQKMKKLGTVYEIEMLSELSLDK